MVLRKYHGDMKTVTSSEAKAKLSALLAEVERTGMSVTITSRGTPVAVLAPVHPRQRSVGQLPPHAVPENIDEPLAAGEIEAWESD
jgi:prevent-host-death family protein